MNKTLNLVSWFILFLGFIVVLTTFYWLLWPYKTVEFKDKVFPVINKVVKQGGSLQYISRYCKYTEQTPIVSRVFANDLLFVVPSTVGTRPTGCHTVNVAIQIPQELPPGTYHLINTFEYQMNPLREIRVTHDTEDFKVE